MGVVKNKRGRGVAGGQKGEEVECGEGYTPSRPGMRSRGGIFSCG